MRHIGYRTLAMAAVLAVGGAAGAAAQGSGIPVRKDVDRSAMMPADTGRVEMVSGGDVMLPSGMTDANITAHLWRGDSLEVQLAQLAQARAQDQRVRDFAAVLVRDHSQAMTDVHELITDEDIGRTPNPADTSAMHMRQAYEHLASLSGAAFDREFITMQAHHHAMELQMLPAMRAAARDDDLVQHLDRIRPILESHRATAMQVAQAMGFTIPAMPMHHGMMH